MPASEAQIAASRANGLKSRGPRTAEGKAISRRNAYKHGMAGEGVVLSEGDVAEVARRSSAMLEEMRPACEMGRYLVRRLARLTVRVERCSSQELASNEYRATHAEADFDEARIAEVDQTLAYIAREPATLARKLRSMPEGIDRVIALMLDLREELNTGRWDWTYGDRLANLTGRRWMDVPVTRVRALSEAIVGDFQFLRPGEGEGLSAADRVDWARNAMADLIDEELESLLADRKTLDVEAIERDRAGAADRSAFDPSKEATLARRYEAAADRGVFRTLNELRRVEAEAASAPMSGAESEPPGSFRAREPEPAGALDLTPRAPSTNQSSVIRPTPERSGSSTEVANPGSRMSQTACPSSPSISEAACQSPRLPARAIPDLRMDRASFTSPASRYD